MKETPQVSRLAPALLCGAVVFFCLYLVSLYNFLLFHSLAEIFSVVIAASIFALAWNSRGFTDDRYLVIIGIAFLFVGAIDLLHTLAYKGMGVFPGEGPDLSTQLWIAARYLQSASFVLALWLTDRKVRYSLVFLALLAISSLLLSAIFIWGVFPPCFLEGSGLTPFKIASEYVISSFFALAIALLLLRRKRFHPRVFGFLILSLTLTVFSEMAFTLYEDVYGFYNMLGHLFKVAAFYFIYKAIIETGLVAPYNLLFHNLKQSEEAVRRAHDRLEMRVKERTAELTRAYNALQAEMGERRLVEEALRDSERKYSRLVESSLTGIYIDQDGKIAFCNQQLADLFGYPREEIVGLESWKLVHPGDRAMTDDLRQRRLRGDPVPAEYEARGLNRKGETLWVLRRNARIEYRGRPAVLGNIVDITRRKEMEDALKVSEKELRALSFQLLAAQENERKLIAQELHDSIGQTLVAIKFGLERKIDRMGGGKAPEGISLEDILGMVQGGLEETRRIMTNLRPSVLDDLGILATISWFCREFEKVHPGFRLQKEIWVEEDEVPERLKIVIFRILQEAMNNIAKHSGGDRVDLRLSEEGGKLVLRVGDNGAGFDPESCRKGLGLSSMKERAQHSGGFFTLDTSPGKGTRVEAAWPL